MLIPVALAAGCCGRLSRMSVSSLLDLAFSNERTNRNHLSRIRPLSRSSLPSSSGTHCDSTFFYSSSCTDLIYWKNPCWSLMRSCFSNSKTWRSKKRTTAALCNPSMCSRYSSIFDILLLNKSSRVPRRRPFIHLKLSFAIGSVPSLSGHVIAYRWRSLPRGCRHGTSEPQGSSERVCDPLTFLPLCDHDSEIGT